MSERCESFRAQRLDEPCEGRIVRTPMGVPMCEKHERRLRLVVANITEHPMEDPA